MSDEEEVEDEVEDDEEDDEAYWAAEDEMKEERFEALCAALRRNDPDTTEIPRTAVANLHGRRLGEALQGNQYVSSMDLDLGCFLDDDDDDEGTDSVALLLRYIRESEAMRKVDLWGGAEEAGRTFFLAMAENPCIEELRMDSIRIGPFAESFALFLRTTRSLKTLSMFLGGIEKHDASRELVAEAFGVNQTLESLKFFDRTDGATDTDTAMVESVLSRLGSHPRLRELTLVGDFTDVAHIDALASFLGSTSLLEHLYLSFYRFNKENMEDLVGALYSNQSLTKLSLRNCTIDSEATNVFRTFMQSCETRSSIRELCIDSVNDGVFEGSSDRAILASMVTMPDENQGTGSSSSIGSSLQMLDLGNGNVFAGFCDAFAANASRIRLPCLCTDISTDGDWETLNRCLPKLVYLKELEFHPFRDRDEDGISRGLVAALGTNGSLQRVIVNHTGFFNEAELRLIQLISQRNELIPISVTNGKTELSLLPMLFQSAKQAPRTAPNSILLGLLAASNSIGPRSYTTMPRAEEEIDNEDDSRKRPAVEATTVAEKPLASKKKREY